MWGTKPDALTPFSPDCYLDSVKMESEIQDFSFTLHCWSYWKLFYWCTWALLQHPNLPALSDCIRICHFWKSLPFPWIKWVTLQIPLSVVIPRFPWNYQYTLCLSRHIKILVTSLRCIWHFISYCKFYISTPKVMELSCLNKCFLKQLTVWTASLQKLSLLLVVDGRKQTSSFVNKIPCWGGKSQIKVFSSEKNPHVYVL